MSESIGLWAVDGGVLRRCHPQPVDRESRLESWIESNPDVLGERFLIVGRQVRTRYGGILDLLAVDSEGRCVVLELKRGRTPREIVAQALDYVSWIAELSDEGIREIAARSRGVALHDAYRDRFPGARPPDRFNTDQRIIVVATDVDDATARIVQHLTRRYGIDINVVALSYFSVNGVDMLARTWVVDPADLEERIDGRVTVSEDREAEATGLWHVNVGVHAAESIGRNWDDPRRNGFLSAGQGPKWRDELMRLSVGDPVYAYLNGAGYVGGGTIVAAAVPAREFAPPDSAVPLRDLPLEGQGWFINAADPDLSEYMVGVAWNKTVSQDQGFRVAHPLRGTVKRIWSEGLAAELRGEFG